MNKNVKRVLIGIPFLIGILMFSFCIYNLVSSLLFFCGGYIFLKNIFSYKKDKKTVNNINGVIKNCNSFIREDKGINIPSIKRCKRMIRVRKRVK